MFWPPSVSVHMAGRYHLDPRLPLVRSCSTNADSPKSYRLRIPLKHSPEPTSKRTNGVGYAWFD